jgi:hypothetical protein
MDRVVHNRRPMSNRVVGVMAPERRRLLLETAAREFARAGYERASLNRIIRSCGMSKSSFYYYLGSKEALFDAVVTEGGAALVAAMDVPDPDEFAGGTSGAGSSGSWTGWWSSASGSRGSPTSAGCSISTTPPADPAPPWDAPWPASTPGWSGRWRPDGPAGPSATTCPPPSSVS